MTETKTITIDSKPYDLDALPETARQQLANVRVIDQEIVKIEQQLAIYKTARAAYARVLKAELDKVETPN